MCFFPFKNNRIDSVAYKKGVREFECGACPECLAKKSKQWALRCSMQAQVQPCCMVTLTYDTYIHDTATGRVIGERVSDLKVCKKDAQKFIKRLRIYFKRKKNVDNIKYLLTAEYGKRTHRAHYHAILFGVEFDDLIRYKKSKRGNWINKSATLDKIWAHGICTVDTVCVNAKIARYCTKYCAKDSRADDTFMLFSRGIGQEELLRQFNGISYVVDGREYPIPRTVWRDYIENKYNIKGFSKYVPFGNRETQLKKRCETLNKQYAKNAKIIKSFDSVAVDNFRRFCENYPVKKPLSRCCPARKYRVHYYQWAHYDALRKAVLYADENKRINVVHNSIYRQLGDSSLYMREEKRFAYRKSIYSHCRDNDTIYKRYLQYWRNKSAVLELGRADIRTRILQLPNSKYFSYKNAALIALGKRAQYFALYGDSDGACVPPRSNCVSAYMRFKAKEEARKCAVLGMARRCLPIFPCYKSANDTTEEKKTILRRLKLSLPCNMSPTDLFADGQISIFD